MSHILSSTALAALLAIAADAPAAEPPKVGDRAPDFNLKTYEGRAVRLSEMTEAGPVVLVVLRGYPGYQCPVCNAQVGDLLGHAKALKEAGAHLVMIYPGSARDLDDHAREFLGERSLPDHFTFLTDPDYNFTDAYNLRWDAPKETAYPSTFVLDREGKVRFALVSKSHGGRAKAAQVVEALKALR